MKTMGVMIRKVLTVKPDTSVIEVAPDCSSRTTSARSVVDDQGQMVGSSAKPT
jgi:CBS-domain-containing membrane protein